MAAAPMGMPGWPELAFCTASADSMRMVLMARSSRVRDSVVGTDSPSTILYCQVGQISDLPGEILRPKSLSSRELLFTEVAALGAGRGGLVSDLEIGGFFASASGVSSGAGCYGGTAVFGFGSQLDLARLGPTWLARLRHVAACVVETLHCAQDQWKLCELISWVVMSNHVHVLLRPLQPLRSITRAIKQRHAARPRPFEPRPQRASDCWQEEAYDHWFAIRPSWAGSADMLSGIRFSAQRAG